MIPILHTEKLCKSFSNGAAQQHVIKNLDLEIMEGDFTVIMGASGSGKSTLLYALSGMDKPTLGKIFFGDTEIQDYSNDQLAVFRRKNCGFVFQGIYLLENQNVLDNVLTGAFAVQKNSPELIKRVKELLAKVGLDEKMQKKYPNQLSGGEAQRVGIVRAVINEPKILFADEPTGALDSNSSAMLLHTLQIMNRELGATILMVTHDVFSACYCEKILFLSDGKICSELERGNMDKKEYLNRILDMQSKIGGDDIYAE